jgi:phytoene dehydrogenase-like protein
MGAVSAAIRAAAEEFGAQVRTSSPVGRVLAPGGRTVGVTLAGSGEEVRAPIVVTTVHPRTAFLEHLSREELPAEFVRDIERWRSRSGVVKINLALDRLPRFSADARSDPDVAREHHTGAMGMAPSIEWVERAFQDARSGRPAARPFSDGVIPSVSDPTLAPDGVHVMSLFTQWVPATWSAEPHREELAAYADRIIACYDDLAPGFAASVQHRDVVGPYDMEREYGLVGGNIFHGELSLEQLFHLRPAPGYADYRTPVRGLYYASSATHAGGGVCGIPGWQAARAAIADARRATRRRPIRTLSQRASRRGTP